MPETTAFEKYGYRKESLGLLDFEIWRSIVYASLATSLVVAFIIHVLVIWSLVLIILYMAINLIGEIKVGKKPYTLFIFYTIFTGYFVFLIHVTLKAL